MSSRLRSNATASPTKAAAALLKSSVTLTESSNQLFPSQQERDDMSIDERPAPQMEKRETRASRKRRLEQNPLTASDDNIPLQSGEFETLPKRRRLVESTISPVLFGPKWRALINIITMRDDLMRYPWGDGSFIHIDDFFEVRYSDALRALNHLTHALRNLFAVSYTLQPNEEERLAICRLMHELYALGESITPDMPRTSKSLDVAIQNLSASVYYLCSHLIHAPGRLTPRYIELVTIVSLKMDELVCHVNTLNSMFFHRNSHLLQEGRRF
jgi:hypothetical protein